MFFRRFAAGACLLFLAAQATHSEDSARIIARYKQLLTANPGPGTVLDRLWALYRDQGKADALLAEYKKAAAGSDLAPALIYGYLLEKADADEAAGAAFERAATLDPSDPRPHLALGDLAMKRGKPRKAADAFGHAADRLRDEDERRLDALLKLGNAWAAAQEPARAAEAWEQIVTGRPNDLSLRRRLTQAYESNGLLKQAAEHYKVIAAKGDAYERVTALRSLAQIYQVLGEPDSAISALENGMAIAAAGNWLREELEGELIRLHQKFGRVAELEKRWLDNVEQNPRDLGAYLQLISLYSQTSEVEKERHWLDRLVGLAPQNAGYKLRLARVLIRLNKPDEAGRIYDELLTAQPQNADLVLARAELDVQQGAVAKAESQIESLLSDTADESLQSRAVEFYRRHRLWDMVEKHLARAAAAPDASPEAALALGDYYFTQGDTDEARRALQNLVKPGADPAARAAAWAQIASSLRDHGENESAEDALRSAIELAPAEASFYIQLGEVLATREKTDQAQQALEKAVEIARDPAAKLTADEKLFQLLQTGAAAAPKPDRTPLLDAKDLTEMLSLSSSPSSDASAGAVLGAYLEKLAKDATEYPSLDTLLRAARWHLWARAYGAAEQFAAKAIELDPGALEPRELAVKIFEGAGRLPEAVEQLKELARIDAAGTNDRLRKAARIEAESGQMDSALDTLEKLADEEPADVKVLSDYALALQQADRWPDALQVWQRAYETSGAGDRKSIVQPMLRVLERLGQHDRAVSLLLEAADAENDRPSKNNLLHDLLQYAVSHDRGDWLRSEFERRHQAHPNDYFTLASLARILKSEGRDEEAFELLRDATYSAPEPVVALEDLVAEGEELGRYEEAIDAQRRLIWMRPRLEAEGFEKLAALQETWLEIAGAKETWDEIVSRFPRDLTALKRAAAFFTRWQYPGSSREVLRRMRVLEPRDFDALIELAAIAIDAGEISEALSAYEQILQNSSPAAGDAALRFPARKAVEAGPLQQSYFQAARLRNGMPNPKTMQAVRSFWTEGSHEPRTDEDYRLEAIRGISELRCAAGDDRAIEDWLREWERGPDKPPVEALWAYYYSGAGGRTLAQMKALAAKFHDDANVKQAFVWLCLQLKSYGALREWLAAPARQPADHDMFMVALGQELTGTRSRSAAALLEGLFPPEFKTRQVLWQAAALFAGQGHLNEAARLGERVFNDAIVGRAEYGNEVGSWYLYAGGIEDARRVLGSAAQGVGASFDNAVYETLRRYYLSLPENERTPFAENFLEQTARRDAPMHAAIVRVLLSGLEGKSEDAEAALDDLIELRPVSWTGDFDESATQRYWRFVLTAGAQLQVWKLNSLASYLWQAALADEASIRLQGAEVVDIVRELRLRLIAAQLLEDTPMEAQVRIAEFAHSSTSEMIVVLSSMLENSGFFAQSVQALSYLVERDPANPQYLRSLLNACRGADDVETASRLIESAISHGFSQSGSHREIVIQFIEFLIGRNDLDAAMALIRKSAAEGGNDSQLLEREARIQVARGRLEEAEKAYRELVSLDDSDVSFRFSLAGILEKRGKIDQAIETILPAIARAPGTAAEMRLANLYLKKGDIGKVRSLAHRLLRAHSGAEVPPLASQLAASGQKRLALVMLQSAITQLGDPRLLVDLQLQALQLMDREKQPVLFEKSLARLKDFAGVQPDLALRYYDFRQAVSAETDEKDRIDELLADWADGGGNGAAGVKLAEVCAAKGDAPQLDELLDQLLQRDDADVVALGRLGDRLKESKFFDEALRVTGHLIEMQPMQEQLWFDHARMLVATGRKAAAVEQLERLSRRRVLNDAVTGRLAEAYMELGETEKAERLFEDAVKGDPTARNFGLLNDYAQLLLRKGDLQKAGRIISSAFRNRNNEDTSVLLGYIEAMDALDSPERALAALKLPAAAVQRCYIALFRQRQSKNETAEAIRLIQHHPDILAAEPSAVRSLEGLAEASGRFAQVAEILESCLSQQETPDTDIRRVLARMYTKMAAQEVTREQPDAALLALRRAHGLLPGDFEIASQLADLLVKRGELVEAASVWLKVIESAGDDETKGRAKEKLTLLHHS